LGEGGGGTIQFFRMDNRGEEFETDIWKGGKMQREGNDEEYNFYLKRPIPRRGEGCPVPSFGGGENQKRRGGGKSGSKQQRIKEKPKSTLKGVWLDGTLENML